MVSSFQTQYGIRLAKELNGMSWKEFSALISGLNDKTPLGTIVAIRSEDNPEHLKEFTPEQRRIRSEWRTRRAKEKPQDKVDEFIESMKNIFLSMAGE